MVSPFVAIVANFGDNMSLFYGFVENETVKPYQEKEIERMKNAMSYEMFPLKGKKGRPSKMPTLEQLASDYALMGYPELSEKYGVPVATVKGWITRARRGDFDARC